MSNVFDHYFTAVLLYINADIYREGAVHGPIY